jgi:two-component system chemotaxis response regulator CheB
MAPGCSASNAASAALSGGYTIAEHESTAVVYGMPKAAVDRGAACEALPLKAIARRVLDLVTVRQELSWNA